MDDVAYLEAMYAAGLQGHFDAIGIHNYGYGGPPEDNEWGYGLLNFRRAEDVHAVMVAHGDGDMPVWATEFGWLHESATCNAYWQQIGFAWQQVTAQQQADYLVQAFAYADEHWPWMGPMIVSNLDFSVMPWYSACEPLRYFAILNEDRTPRPAYTALAEMDKHPRSWAIGGIAAAPAALSWMQAVSETQVVTRVVTVRNTGEVDFAWRADVSTTTLSVTIDPPSGVCDTSLTVTVDPRGLPVGTYTAAITLSADTSEVPESPLVVPLHVDVVARIYGVYLPLTQRQ